MGFRALTMAAVAIMLASIISVSFAAQRVVLLEDATSTTCPPCGTAHPTLQAIRTNFGSQLVTVAWHCWWPAPGDDPFYWHNTPPQSTRIGYYAINGIPDMCIDGAGAGNSVPPDPFTYSQIANAINARLAIPSPIAFQNTSGLLQCSDLNLSFDLNVETPTAGANFRLFVIATEEDIPYNWQGQTHCYDVFRRSNANTGELIDLSVGGVQHFNRTLPYNSTYNPLGLHGVLFVQNYDTKEIIQAGEFPISAAYYSTIAHTTPAVQIANPNTAVNFAGTIRNQGTNADVFNVAVAGLPAGWSYSYTTPAGTFSGPSTLSLAVGQTAPISLTLNSLGNPGPATLQMSFASQNSPCPQPLTLEFRKLNGLDVLLVDDDMGETRETSYTPSLNAAGVTWARWSIAQYGTLTGQNLIDAATAVVWFCGAGASEPSFTASERQAVTAFLATGGDLFVNGSDVGYTLADPASPHYSAESAAWFTNNLHASYTTNFAFSSTISGVAGDPISDGLTNVVLSNSPYGVGLMDGVQAAGSGAVVWTINNQVHKGGTRAATGESKVVYFTFPFECLPQANQRDLVMDRIIEYFGGTTAVEDPVASVPVRSTLAQNAPNPFNPATVIGYTLASAGQVELRIYDLNGRMVRELVNAPQAASRYQVEWDGRDDLGRSLASGVYFYQLNAPGNSETRRMVLTK